MRAGRIPLRLNYRRRGRHQDHRPGQAMVEMAIVMMLLLVLCFGMADFGLYMYKYVQAANCTREAARRAAVRQDPTNIPYCVDASLAPSVTYADASHSTGSDVTASINFNYNWIVIDHLIPGLSPTIALQSHTTMRLEGAEV